MKDESASVRLLRRSNHACTVLASLGEVSITRRFRGPGAAARCAAVLPLLFASTAVTHQAVQSPVRLPDIPVAITHVTVIDVVTGAKLPDRTVLLRDQRIMALDTTGRVRVPAGARRVDGRGRFLIPGLWDMHGHFAGDRLTRRNFFPLFIANGVTGVRDMWGDCDSLCAVDEADNDRPVSAAIVAQWKRDISRGALTGPRLVAASAMFDGPEPDFPGSYAIHSPEEGRIKVRVAHAHGVDFIKVLNGLSRESYLAILDEAKRQGLPVAGHVPFSMTPREVSSAGQRSIEHWGDVVGFGSAGKNAACSTQPAAVREALQAARATQDTTRQTLARLRADYLHVLTATYSEALCADLFAEFVRNGTARVLTLIGARNSEVVRLGDTLLAADPRLRYVDSETRSAWLAAAPIGPRSRRLTVDSIATIAYLDLLLSLPGAMQRAGVLLLAGTDEPNPWVIPGFSLHDELAILVRGGLTPLQALQSATINPARFLGATDSLGAVAPGKLADLVLLDGDPLEDIHNTTRVVAVFTAGRYHGRVELAALLAQAARAAGARER
ncbi:MAG TPA: amidohydrolase family protein [Gemmatimonadales bacterium]|nr:amidohydrolase family protein [Gemmatimonadales bacterium]